MIAWLTENLATILLTAALAVALYFISRSMKRNHSCDCGCDACPMAEECHEKEKDGNCQ